MSKTDRHYVGLSHQEIKALGAVSGEAFRLYVAVASFAYGRKTTAFPTWRQIGERMGKKLTAEAGQASANSGNGPAQTAFNALRLIVTVGWAIYPIGYAVGYFGGGIDAGSLNVIYNFADFVNKIAFGLIIYVAATADSNA